MSSDALTRGLTGWGESTQTSHIHSTGVDGYSSEDIDLDYMSPYVGDGGGRIQVTTVVEQDVERLAEEADSESTRSLVGPTGMHSGSEGSFMGAQSASSTRTRG
jgi:hypothetical protein